MSFMSMSGAAAPVASSSGSPSKLFYFYHPTVARSASTSSTDSAKSSTSSSSTSGSSEPHSPSWSPSLSSVTTEESYFSAKRPSSSKGLTFNQRSAATCHSTCRCTRCQLGDFVFDNEDDYRDYLEIIQQAQQAGAVLDRVPLQVSSVALPISTAVERSSSCPPVRP